MAVVTSAVLKTYFEAGDKPTEAQFIDLIDTLFDQGVGAINLDDITNVTAPSPSTGEVLKWNGSAWVNDTDSTGGAGSASLYDAGNGAFVCADGTGVTFARTSSTEGTFTVPSGVVLFGGTIHHTSGQNPGTNYYVQFSLGGTRDTNNDKDDLNPPFFWVGNKTLPDAAGSISRSNYVKYGVTVNTPNLEQRVTGVGPLEIQLLNVNNSNAGGASGLLIGFSCPGGI